MRWLLRLLVRYHGISEVRGTKLKGGLGVSGSHLNADVVLGAEQREPGGLLTSHPICPLAKEAVGIS